MPDPIPFLHSLAQALSALALYPPGHVSRERALEAAYEKLKDLIASSESIEFSFLGDEVVFADRPIRELRGWEWSAKFAGIGVQRLEFSDIVTRDELEEFLDMALARVALKSIDTSEARQTRPSGIRYGLVGIRGLQKTGQDGVRTATISYSVGEEADTIRWMHEQLVDGRQLPMMEAEAVVRALAVAMHGDQEVMLPLLRLREFDEYTTTHSLNVCVLSMALAEWLGLGADDVRGFGVAGLMHDIGKVRVPLEILNKPGKLSDKERRVMNQHPVDGARIIIATEPDQDLSAVVAYEHHIMLNGGGYPSLHYERDCHRGSKLVHVCDVFDALRTDRPYRDAWETDEILHYLEHRAGVEFDLEMVRAFTQMMRQWEPAEATDTPAPDKEEVPAEDVGAVPSADAANDG